MEGWASTISSIEVSSDTSSETSSNTSVSSMRSSTRASLSFIIILYTLQFGKIESTL